MSIQDFLMEQQNDGTFDLVVDPITKQFKSVAGFETAINVQLFIDQRVTKDEVANVQRRKGWIGDMITREEGYSIGSLVFLKNQARNTPLDNNEVASYAEDSLKYLVIIGASKEVTARVNGSDIEGTITNDENETSRYNRLWRVTAQNG